MNIRLHTGTLLFAVASFLMPTVLHADVFSPTASYSYADGVALSPDVSYQFNEGIGLSPVVSYQYYEWPGNDVLNLQNSPLVSYLFQIGGGAPFIVVQPTDQLVQSGATATFAVLADGQAPLSYQWRFNNNPIAGAASTYLSFNNGQFINAGGYSVIVTNTYGSVTSSVAQLTVFTNLVLTQINKAPPPHGNSTIPTDATHFKVFTNGSLVSGITLDFNKSTIVLTHGWNDSSSNWPLEMANDIRFWLGASTPNIVAWDWTAEAQDSHPAGPASRTQGQGYALGTNLVAALGANYSQKIHFIGHSLGTLVNAKAANTIHAKGFSWTNTQMTLLDEASAATGLAADAWQTATTLAQNDSNPNKDWKPALPDECAWADNYITAFGMPHPQAVNVILTNLYPNVSDVQNLFDFTTAIWDQHFQAQATIYHVYSYIWYDNSASQINNPNDPPYLMGFKRSWEGGGNSGRPSTNTYYIESTDCPASFPSYSGYNPAYNLVQINRDQANQFLNARPQNLISSVGIDMVESSDNILANAPSQAHAILQSGQTWNPFVTVPFLFQYDKATLVKLATGWLAGSPSSNTSPHPLGGPTPGSNGTNVPAYVWIPVTVPSNAISMSFNFMLEGDGKQDSFQAALNTNDLLTVETVLLQTNVTMNSGFFDVSQYAGQQAELFFGIIGGTSTNASVTVSGIAFYVTLPPLLQAQMSGSNLVLSWPMSAQNFSLQATTNLADPNSWITLTNVPAIVNLHNTVTNPISSGAQFYRLKQ